MTSRIPRATVDPREPKSKKGKYSSEEDLYLIKCLVQPFEWQTDPLPEYAGTELVVRCWCKDTEARLHLLLFKGFAFTVYLQLPCTACDGRVLAWNGPQIRGLLGYIREDQSLSDCRPVSTELVKKHKVYFADSPLVMFVRVRFSTHKSVKRFCYTMRQPQVLAHTGKVVFSLHEDNVKVLTKFLARTGMRCTQWMEVQCREVEDHLRLSTSAMEYEADFESVRPVEMELSLPYKVLSFDIEVFSSVDNRFPRAINKEDEIFAISMVSETFKPRTESQKVRANDGACVLAKAIE